MGGGGKLGGGTYALLLYLGMIFGRYYKIIITNRNSLFCCVVAIGSTICAILSWVSMCKYGTFLDKGFFGEGFNPPGIHLMFYAIFIMFAICFWDRVVELSNIRFINAIFDKISLVGTQTLYIFLYHRLFLDYFLHDCSINFAPLRYIVFYSVMIFGSIVMGLISKTVVVVIGNSYNYPRKQVGRDIQK